MKPTKAMFAHANKVQAKELAELRARLEDAEMLLQSVCRCGNPCDQCRERVDSFMAGEVVFARPEQAGSIPARWPRSGEGHGATP